GDRGGALHRPAGDVPGGEDVEGGGDERSGQGVRAGDEQHGHDDEGQDRGVGQGVDAAADGGEDGAADAGQEGRYAEDHELGDVGVGPVGVDGHRRVGHGPQQPAQPAPADGPGQQQAGHGDGQDHVVVPDVALQVDA